MELIESSETSAYINTLTPGTYQKEKKLQLNSTLKIVKNVRNLEKKLTNQNSSHEEIPGRLSLEMLAISLSFCSVGFVPLFAAEN